jgi:hypothetical protein
MKKISYILLLTLISINILSAQKWNDRKENNRKNLQENNRWILGFGVNGLNNSGDVTKNLTKADNWTFAKIPFYLSAELIFDGQFSVASTLSLNYFTGGKFMNGEKIIGEDQGGNDAGYLAFDMNVKYSFSKLLDSNAFEPYLFTGVGVSHFGDYYTQENPAELIEDISIFTFNAGFGMNYWFSSNWGVNLNATGKWGIAATSTNHLQSSIGVLYHIK